MAKARQPSTSDKMTEKEKAYEDRIDAVIAERGFKSRWCVDDTTIHFDKPHRFTAANKVFVGVGDQARVYAYINGPLWVDVWEAAERVIERSLDPGARFIEGFKLSGDASLQLQTRR